MSASGLRFPVPRELNRRTCAVLEDLEQAEDAVAQREALAEVVVALTECGLEAYFMAPLQKAKAGFLSQQSAALGLAGTRKLMGPVIRSIIGRMDAPQLRSVGGSIRSFMR